MVRVAIAGVSGWRGRMFAGLCDALDSVELVGVLSRSGREVPAPSYRSVDELVSGCRPELVVTAVPWPVTPGLVTALVEAGVKVLAETPPAPDAPGLRSLWSAVGERRAVQVAEQYLFLPGHAARLAVVRGGLIGTPTQVQVSSTHTYHAVSMIRGLLGIEDDCSPVRVVATSVSGPLVDPLNRAGWTDDDEPKPAGNVVAVLDFGDGRSGLYDFTDNQWHNQLRMRRIVVRGSRGELRDDEVVRLAGPRTIVRERIVRSQLGYDLNLDGYDTEHLSIGGEILWRNPYLGRRWMDEEIAMAAVVDRTAAWIAGDGPEPYPLARACQDHLIGLTIDSVAHGSGSGTVETGPWG